MPHPVWSFALSLVLGALSLLGALAWWWRPREGETSLPALYFLVTAAITYVWEWGFLYLGAELSSRLLWPVLPFFLMALGRGVQEVLERFHWAKPAILRSALFAGLSLSLLLTCSYAYKVYVYRMAYPGLAAPAALKDFDSLFAFLRKEVPSRSLVSCWAPGLVSLYSDRYSLGAPLFATPQLLNLFLRIYGPDYYVGIPSLDNKDGKVFDRQVKLLNDFNQAYPGILEPVFFTDNRKMVVFKIDKVKLWHVGPPLPVAGNS